MKKILLFISVLVVSLMTSGCINNLAIQELNDKAKTYIDQGNYEEGIKRLESSIDLDGNVFETRYNLAAAYINVEKYQNAIEQINEAIKLNPKNADSYYTLGVAYEGLADSAIENKEEDKGDENNDEPASLSPEAAQNAAESLEAAVLNYKKYLEMNLEAEDAEKVKVHIQELEAKIREYKEIGAKSGALAE